jgi:urease accessory protein
MPRYLGRTAALLLLATMLAVDPAAAHHVMGGRMPATFLEGLLSGLGHPVIGIDHLAFLVAVGVAVGAYGLNLAMPVIFVAASAIGVAVHLQAITIPAAELLVAASVIATGALIARGAALGSLAWAALFAFAGLLHGYAYGESMFGAETSPLAAYLIGLVVVQAALTIGIAFVVSRLGGTATATSPRLAGAVIAGIGIAVLAQQVLPG